MLTGKNTQPQQAVHYFMSGYYQEGTSRWSGKGAEKLGLLGAVDDQETFLTSSMGCHQMVVNTWLKESWNHRNDGQQQTLLSQHQKCQPAIVGRRDERLITAHQLAVQKL
ncbi:hypothetical protein [Nostoc sp. MS1]|uniref:hypothetical protein n=1 Tax=Nostoc sp. MS1 TaxID=2764711 RepID=UPI0030864B46|nr:hypothetical protein NSMS1_66860 [Nostoc sp. MS1]